ncbi:hypothetical protein M9458_040901, partial [Cirrhinus mrigala]
VITVEVWTTTLKSVAFHPSQRSVTTVRVSRTWALSPSTSQDPQRPSTSAQSQEEGSR